MERRPRNIVSATRFDGLVPVAIVAYALLGILDLGFSKMAFFAGYGEANPVLRSTLEFGTFEVSKVMMTMLVAVVGTVLWPIRAVRTIMWLANIGMAVLAGFHVYGLFAHIAK